MGDLHINELLTYATFYMNKSCIDHIKKIISSFYTNEEIVEAKKLLWEIKGSELQAYSERKNTDKRSSSDANISDIFDGLTKLDILDQIPIFVAKKMDRIPKREPEELNTVSIIDRLGRIEKKIDEYGDTLSNHEIDLTYIKTLNIENELKSVNDKIDTFQIKSNIISPPLSFSDEDSNPIKSIDGANATKYDVTGDNSRLESEWETTDDESKHLNTNKKLSYREASLRFISNIHNQNNRNNLKKKGPTLVVTPKEPKETPRNIIEADGFQLVETKQQRRRRFGESEGLRGAPSPKRDIFVSRVQSGNVFIVKRFLNNNNIMNDDIKCVSHDNSKFKSFKVTISKSDLPNVMENKFWPKGVLCSVWKERNQKNVQYYNSKYIDNHYLS